MTEQVKLITALQMSIIACKSAVPIQRDLIEVSDKKEYIIE